MHLLSAHSSHPRNFIPRPAVNPFPPQVDGGEFEGQGSNIHFVLSVVVVVVDVVV